MQRSFVKETGMNSSLFDLTGQSAIVAGGAGDLGHVIVEGLQDAGVELVVLDRAENIVELAESLCRPGRSKVTGIQVDLTDRASVEQAFEAALKCLGKLDILVNAQGIQRRYPSEKFPLSEWDLVLETNLTSVFELCQLAGRVMLAQGHGRIINIASLNSFTGGITIPAYAASKAGVASMTKTLSNEWSARGVNVNAIAPGYMDTKMTAAIKADPVRNPQILARIPIGRWGTGEDLVGPVLFLASPASQYITGDVLPVDGGWMGR
jgi:2-deoxy-D-gluconate 3-dehydrogenase